MSFMVTLVLAGFVCKLDNLAQARVIREGGPEGGPLSGRNASMRSNCRTFSQLMTNKGGPEP